MASRPLVAVFCGARPNVPKVWTLLRAFDLIRQRALSPPEHVVVHSGQHHHPGLGEDYGEALGVPIDYQLGVGSGESDGHQLALLAGAVDGVLARLSPDVVIVVGDVNTTLAAALVAARRGLPVVHLEAGLRSGLHDPEEINRKAVSACAWFHLAPSESGLRNLVAEGVPSERVALVGNTMAETFLAHREHRRRSLILDQLGVERRSYVLLTAHKVWTTMSPDRLFSLLGDLARHRPVVFPVHPRARSLLDRHGRWPVPDNVVVTEPLPYADFGRLLEDSELVVTDSDGAQEEATVAGVPCVTVAPATARPETIELGTNVLAHGPVERWLQEAPSRRRPCRVPCWDTGVSTRIADALGSLLVRLEGFGWTIRAEEPPRKMRAVP